MLDPAPARPTHPSAILIRRHRRRLPAVLALLALSAMVAGLVDGTAQAQDETPLEAQSAIQRQMKATPHAPPSSVVAPYYEASEPLPGAAGLVDTADRPADARPAQQDDPVVDVAVRAEAFVPAVVTITVGSVVRWTNEDTTTHSTTSVDGYWNWALLPGARFGVRFLSPGVFDYFCAYHQEDGPRGRVVVLPRQGGEITPPIPGPTATPQPTPPPGQLPGAGDIVYDYFADEGARGQSELFLVDPAGGTPRRLTFSEGRSEVQPSWSPAKDAIAYSASATTGSAGPWRLQRLDLSTSQVRDLTAGPADFEPDWHPGGNWIAYTHIERGATAGRSEIRLIPAAGGTPTVLVRLDASGAVVADPSWSPDGNSLAFTVGGLTGGELYRWQPGRIDRLLFHPGWDDIDPAWSPDGRYVAFASGRLIAGSSRTRHDIWLLDNQTGQAGAVAGHPTWDLRRPAWSPDGSRLVFTARFDEGPDRWALYTVPATGGTVSGPLTVGVEPDWASRTRTGLPTPMPGATNTPPAPPPFPTPNDPTATPGATPTVGPPPTFPPPVEPTPTLVSPTAPPTDLPPGATPTATSTQAPPTTARIHLPLGLSRAPLGGSEATLP